MAIELRAIERIAELSQTAIFAVDIQQGSEQ